MYVLLTGLSHTKKGPQMPPHARTFQQSFILKPLSCSRAAAFSFEGTSSWNIFRINSSSLVDFWHSISKRIIQGAARSCKRHSTKATIFSLEWLHNVSYFSIEQKKILTNSHFRSATGPRKTGIVATLIALNIAPDCFTESFSLVLSCACNIWIRIVGCSTVDYNTVNCRSKCETSAGSTHWTSAAPLFHLTVIILPNALLKSLDATKHKRGVIITTKSPISTDCSDEAYCFHRSVQSSCIPYIEFKRV